MLKSPLLIGTQGEREKATRIGIARISVGSTLLLPGGLSRRIFGVAEDQETGLARLLGRLFGIRNIALGVWTLQARAQGRERRRLCYQVNAAVDAADLAVLAIAASTDRGLLRASLMSSVLGSSALLAWLEVLADAG